VVISFAANASQQIKNSSFKLEESHLHRWTNVWIGPGGATTFTHYDIFYNFYVQLYGKKRYACCLEVIMTNRLQIYFVFS
jgi:hypothetical protein